MPPKVGIRGAMKGTRDRKDFVAPRRGNKNRSEVSRGRFACRIVISRTINIDAQ